MSAVMIVPLDRNEVRVLLFIRVTSVPSNMDIIKTKMMIRNA